MTTFPKIVWSAGALALLKEATDRVSSAVNVKLNEPKDEDMKPPADDERDEDMKRIPISAGKLIADKYGYDQVVIIARKTGADGGEHCTTYGITKEHCVIAARIGDFLKYRVMGWLNNGI